jgi:hypothetical protein
MVVLDTATGPVTVFPSRSFSPSGKMPTVGTVIHVVGRRHGSCVFARTIVQVDTR